MRKQEGFTIVELLIVVIIIGILSVLVIPNLNKSKDRAKSAKAKGDIDTFIKATVAARIDSGNVNLRTITGVSWSANGCYNRDLRNVPTSDSCYINWNNALTKVIDAVHGGVNGLDMARDPWGSPYLLDENEGEQIATPCRYDSLVSAGPDGRSGSPSDSYNADNLTYTIPFAGQCSS